MMKLIKLMGVLLLGSSFALTSCCKSDKKDDVQEVKMNKNVKLVEIKTTAEGSQDDPMKQTGAFIKFSFKEGKVVTGDDWDFAVRGRIFLTNGRSKLGMTEGLIYGEGEPARIKAVKVVSLVGEFSALKTIGGLVSTQWHQDYEYASGFQNGAGLAISFASHTRDDSQTRQAWHLRAGKDGGQNLILRPVVFLFLTQDGKVAKMQITKITRTNKDFDKKEDITYTIKYFYNPNSSVDVDETK